MDKNIKKQKMVTDVLAGQYGKEGTTIDQLALKMLGTVDSSALSSSRMLWYANSLVGLGFGIFFWFFAKKVDQPVVEISVCFIYLALTIWLILWLVKRHKDYHAFIETLYGPFKELVDLKECLASYLKDFDERTSNYFHCVTNTKVTAYYVLSQINTAMADVISDCNHLLAKPSYERVQKACRILGGKLIVSEGFVIEVGKLHVVPLERLHSTILQLIENLETDTKYMEKDMSVFRKDQPVD